MCCCRFLYSKSKGVQLSRGCTTGALVLAFLYLLISLAYTLTTRLYLRAYYNSAHVAGLSVFIALFVISHHLFCNNYSLQCSVRAYTGVQVAWGLWSLICCTGAGVCYSMLAARGNLNFDYVASLAFCWADMFFMLYLVVVSCAGACGSLKENQYDFTYGGRNINVYTVGNGNNQKKEPSPTTASSSSSSCCSRCCRTCCAVLYGFIYLLFHVIFAVIVFLTAYYPATILYNAYNVQPTADMYRVEVPGHRPMDLFMRCRGNGSQTLVFENGLGGLAMMEWDFIPKILSDRYRVCVHDRRGYGWSQGFEWDNIDVEPQWAENNALFFQALVREANISTPFYYIGHSYGGIHLAYNAHLFPETVKGLVFLDTAKFSPVTSLRDFLEVIVNFNALGLVGIGFDTGLLDYKALFNGVIDFNNVDNATRDNLFASISTGYYFEAFLTEQDGLEKDVPANYSNSWPAYKLDETLRGATINTPLLVLDAAEKVDTFPRDKFSAYQEYYHYGVPGSDHQTLVYYYPYVRTVAGLIDRFIQLQEGIISNSSFVEFAEIATRTPTM